ncbi:MAG: class I SAM-dependent methyltransferase [Gemmatimonadota bacterium]
MLQLDMHLALLDEGASLSDASAYNLQFQGPDPVFIDVLSMRRYREGEYWTGHRQFCEQFLNPLLLRSAVGVAFNAWFRGDLEGIPTKDLARVLPLRRRMSWKILTHVVLQARLEQKAIDDPEGSLARLRGHRFNRASYLGMLRQLRAWIATMEPAATGKTVWEDYQEAHRYGSEDERSKRDFVTRFVSATEPKLLWDLGCNVGYYSSVALKAGAREVIGFDSDFNALEIAFQRAKSQGLAFLPLFMDAANPSPDQGWRQRERLGLAQRARADGILALAFAHHLAIGRNAPIPQVISWLTGVAPQGIIEFVPKSDPTVGQMLALREDIFKSYSRENFMASVERTARVVETRQLESGRLLCWYDRRA